MGLKAAMFQRFTVAGAADAHDSSHGISDNLFALELAVGAILSEGRDGGQHQAGVQLFQVYIIEPKGGHITGLEGLNHNIGVLCQLF